MAKCSICGNKIEYNQFKIIRKYVFCLDCAKAVSRKTKAIVKPRRKAKKAMKKYGVK